MKKNELKQQENLNHLFETEQFDELTKWIEEGKINPKSLIVSYKRHQRKGALFKKTSFWQSRLVICCLEELLVSNLKTDFLHHFFSQNEHANKELFAQLYALNPTDCILFYKMNRAFLHADFVQILKDLSESVDALKLLAEEGRVLMGESEKLKAVEEKFIHYLKAFKTEELFMGIVLYYDGFKKSDQVLGDKKWQQQIENALLDFIQWILEIKIGQKEFTPFRSNDRIQKEFETYSDPHPILGKKESLLIIPPDKTFEAIKNLCHDYIEFKKLSNCLELYQAGFIEMDSADSKIKLNSHHNRFHENDYRKGKEECYFLGVTNSETSSRSSIHHQLECYRFYGIPMMLEWEDERIDLEKLLNLLQQFSAYKGPTEKTIINSSSYWVNNKPRPEFEALFGTNESISVFDYEKLKQGISAYFKWNLDECSQMLEFLSTDLSKELHPGKWYGRPFIKIGNQLVWLGCFLKDRRWDNIILNKIKVEKLDKSIEKQISAGFEEAVEREFKNAGFQTIRNLKISRGELDVVTYKAGYLFICEAKTGQREDDFSYATYMETIKLEEKAAVQLSKAMNQKKEIWRMLKAEFNVNLEVEDIIWFPMIVTDIFEGDNRLFGNGIIKASLLELHIALTNNKKILWEKYALISDDRELLIRIHSEDLDLWNGENECKPERLIEILETNAIWEIHYDSETKLV